MHLNALIFGCTWRNGYFACWECQQPCCCCWCITTITEPYLDHNSILCKYKIISDWSESYIICIWMFWSSVVRGEMATLLVRSVTRLVVAAGASLPSPNHSLIITQFCASTKLSQIDQNHISNVYECSDLRLCSEIWLLCLLGVSAALLLLLVHHYHHRTIFWS